MDVTKDGQATLSLVQDKGTWKPAKGDIALNTSNIQAMASTLATLRAVEWAGAITPLPVLDKPAATITFTTADKRANTVKVGAPSGDDFWNANATGFDGIFHISKTDHDALTADVLPVAGATPAPTVSGTDSAPGK
jgi:hypothetical protein